MEEYSVFTKFKDINYTLNDESLDKAIGFLYCYLRKMEHIEKRRKRLTDKKLSATIKLCH